MSEHRGKGQDNLFHKGYESYKIDDVYHHGMDILRKKGMIESHDAMSGDYLISRWGDDTTRYDCSIFSKGTNEGSSLYLFAFDKFADDYESSMVYSINAPVDDRGDPYIPYIQILNEGSNDGAFYDDDHSDGIKIKISEILNESGVDGPTLTTSGRDMFWSTAASVAIDDVKCNVFLSRYIEESARGERVCRDEGLEAIIARVALSRMILVDSGVAVPAYGAIPIRFIDMQIEERLSQAGVHLDRPQPDA